MTTRFTRSDRILEELSGQHRTLITVVSVLFFAAWLGWFLLADIPVTEASLEARLETESRIHWLQAPVDGILDRYDLRLDSEVARGQILVILDHASLEHEVAEVESRLAASRAQRSWLVRSTDSESEALQATGESDRLESDALRERLRGREAWLRYSERELERLRVQHDAGLVSLDAVERETASVADLRAEIRELRISSDRSTWDQKAEQSDQRAALALLHHEREVLGGEIGALAARAARLRHEIEIRRLRSPVAGHVVEVVPRTPGSFVEAGDPLAAILPGGGLQIVAFFDPRTAVGRIRPRQTAELRLEGFPWLEFGRIEARVVRVAAEPSDGRLRVELEVGDDDGSRVPREHGMPGSVFVRVETSSPARLLLRAAGLASTAPRSAAGQGSRERATPGEGHP